MACWLVAAWVAVAGSARAEGELGLAEVIRTTLELAPGIGLVEAQVEAAEGDLLVTRSAFHPLFDTSLAASQLEDPFLSTSGEPTLSTSESRDAAVGWSQQLRVGAHLEPAIRVRQIPGGDPGSGHDLNEGALDLRLVVPLARDFRSRGLREVERAAELGLRGASFDLRHERSARARDSAAAYWSYLAAAERLAVLRLAEERAGQLVDETRLLVEAEERPAADLNQVEGNAASRRIARLLGEQELVDARIALGLAMGLPATELSTLPAAGDDFPPLLPFSADAATMARLRRLAERGRADLQAAGDRERAASRLLSAAEHDLKPRVDLTTDLAYSTLRLGGSVAPLAGGEVEGLSATVLIRHELPFHNAAARGRLLARRAERRQQEIVRADLRRRIEAALVAEAHRLERQLLAARAAERAVELGRRTVENERRKFQLGFSTLFDVLLAEDALIVALVDRVDARLLHALAILDLRFETATLPVAAGAPERPSAAAFLEAP